MEEAKIDRIKPIALLLALCLCLGLLTACTKEKQKELPAPTFTLPQPKTNAGTEQSGASAASTEVRNDPGEPVSGKYCVLGVDGKRTYPDWTALKFDFANGTFNFGTPTINSSWMRRGELTVEGSRITAVSNKTKDVYEGGEWKLLGNYTWVFELEPDGTIRFLPEDSDEFDIYGTQLTAESVLVWTGELD